LPNNEAAKNGLLATAQRSIQAGRPAIAKWIDATPIDDHHALGKLRPILADLRAAESILSAIVPRTTPSTAIAPIACETLFQTALLNRIGKIRPKTELVWQTEDRARTRNGLGDRCVEE